ncbi:MAG: FtsX-like permease family protein, partial [Clostridiales Family XIII bacterium]|nr:FtsX-like permease family protein [Clostridiales Family XIII bacterium]
YDENYTEIINLPQYDENGVLLNPDDFFFDIMQTKLTYRMDVGWDDTKEETKYRDYELVPVGMISGGMSDWIVSNGFIISLENMKKLESEYKKATGQKTSSSSSSDAMFYYGAAEDGGTTTVEGYETVYVKADDVRNMSDIEKTIKETGYQIYSMSETRKQLQGQVAQTQMMLGGLAAVSLFVAALNIMNTMTMAITERTREIGVMKVLGCKLDNIRQMFLIESGAIGFVGGLVGVALSFLLSLLLNNMTTLLAMLGVDTNIDIASAFGLSGLSDMMPGMKLSVIPPWLVALALVFATAVGLLSGIAPANRAVRISSLEAIRHE